MKISIAIVTYNHERYIAQALDSALNQNLSDFEIVIGEDCSTDSTKLIVQKYQQAYPKIIRLRCHEKNIGARANMQDVLLRCSGEFIAILDGDDYWTDANKLKKQIGLMDNDTTLALCFHPTQLLNEEQAQISEKSINSSDLSLAKLLRHNPVPSVSIVYRRQFIPEFPDWMMANPDLPGDHFIVLSARLAGGIGFLKDTMSVYRQHDQGVWYGLQECSTLKVEIKMNRFFQQSSRNRYWWTIARVNTGLRVRLLWCHVRTTIKALIALFYGKSLKEKSELR